MEALEQTVGSGVLLAKHEQWESYERRRARQRPMELLSLAPRESGSFGRINSVGDLAARAAAASQLSSSPPPRTTPYIARLPPRCPLTLSRNTLLHNTTHAETPNTAKMDRLSRMLAAAQGMGGMGGPAQDTHLIDNSETVYISSLALLKMLRHGRAGVPMEVMGLMLGEFVDDYTVRVVDVFAMPQSGTGVSVEAVDPVFQTKMMDMLRQTGRFATVFDTTSAFTC